ncbi:NRDE family protein [Skermania sp. ID1734]|uniref:NRDE family protein n=1 Tax=Skermania sp. ID1734 TaxID=2597516 RepID=UPI00117E6B25|nr:NRDE family protein [Skermania sp. ID1734]TSD95361.1 NRDE family protein [Skermania sp. ID1734]
MCLIVAAWRPNSTYRLVVAANRDEFYARASVPMHWWPQDCSILAGRDVSPGGCGTWMGLRDDGRFAAITNVREPGRTVPDARTRGEIPVDFLCSDLDCGAFLTELADRADQYNGFNLLASDGLSLWWYSNRNGSPTELGPGIYGVSNAALDTPWPKVVRTKQRFSAAVADDSDVEEYFRLLADTDRPDDTDLPQTGIPLELERTVSPPFIRSPEYGTNSSTVLRVRETGESDIEERRFDNAAQTGAERFEAMLR